MSFGELTDLAYSARPFAHLLTLMTIAFIARRYA